MLGHDCETISVGSEYELAQQPLKYQSSYVRRPIVLFLREQIGRFFLHFAQDDLLFSWLVGGRSLLGRIATWPWRDADGDCARREAWSS